jgi:hypothetical protein
MLARRLPRLAVGCLAAILVASGCDSVPLFAPVDSEITLFPDASAVPTSGTTRIVARVVEPGGTPPHRGTHVAFFTTLGAILPPTAETDDDGFAIVTFVAGPVSGSATVRAASGGASADDLTITISAP